MTLMDLSNDPRARQFLPCLRWLHLFNVSTLRADFFAGFTNATIVLPQAIAFAAIAGLPPEYGLYTAMITPVVAALFGSSMIMISGPSTAISAVVFSAAATDHAPGSAEFVQVVLLLTVLVGIFQILLRLTRLGRLVAFISYSVMIGFTAHHGALYIIARYPPRLKQLKKLNVIDRIGKGRIFDNKGQAISAIGPELDGNICATCRARVFHECSKQPGASTCAKPLPSEAT